MSKKKKKPAWETAVKRAMYQATINEAKRRYKTKTPVFNYRWEHVTAVVTLAEKLADLTGGDRDIVVAAAWLHDIRKDTGNDHPREGAIFALHFLPKTDFPAKKIKRVAYAIRQHMGLWRDKPLTVLEAQILWDADKLTKIGLTAAVHWTAGSLAKGKPHNTRMLIKQGRAADWQEKTVASMHTKPAKKAAKKRLKAYNKFWDKLERELDGEDLK